MARAFVTGAAGFIGHNLTRRLLRDGWDVVAIDAFTDYYDPDLKRRNLASLEGASRLTFIEADIADVAAWTPYTHGITHVFHQAGQPGVRASWGESFSSYTRSNVDATQLLLETFKRHGGLEAFVYASSSSVYGNTDVYPTSEDTLPQPFSPYGVTKLAAEHLCSLYASNFDVPTVSLRYFTVFGPGQRPDMAFTRFLTWGRSGEPIRVFGTGTQVRDFTFVEDVVEANLKAAHAASEMPGHIYNVAGGTTSSLAQALTLIESLVGRPLNLKYEKAVKGDVSRTGGDSSKIREHLGWSPQFNLQAGLEKQYEWLSELDTAHRARKN